MIDRDHKLPLARQAKAVGISRGSIYYRPRPVGEAGLGLRWTPLLRQHEG